MAEPDEPVRPLPVTSWRRRRSEVSLPRRTDTTGPIVIPDAPRGTGPPTHNQ